MKNNDQRNVNWKNCLRDPKNEHNCVHDFPIKSYVILIMEKVTEGYAQ